MAKLALLIGVSDYQPGLAPLPGAIKDIQAMQKVLQDPEIAGFDEINILANPEPQAMQEAIETLFSGRKRDELTLLFFSGHGIKDDRGRLYFATRLTRKNAQGELIKATAVPASFVQDTMSQSRSRRQVVILDCCFSGAFAEGMTAKDDGAVEIEAQLGGEGRAVLTSSTSTQYSFEQQGAGCSVYTNYVVEGIETGAADLDNDGLISIDELHDYARKKVQEASPAMKPKLYATEEGFKINLAKAPMTDPKLIYRKEVERFASEGEISAIGRLTLDQRQQSLNVLPSEAAVIEAEVLKPYRLYKEKLQQYELVLAQAIHRAYPLDEATQRELRYCQSALGLRDEDVEAIAQRLTPKKFKALTQQPTPRSPVPLHLMAIATASVLAAMSIGWWMAYRQQTTAPGGAPVVSDRASSDPTTSPTTGSALSTPIPSATSSPNSTVPDPNPTSSEPMSSEPFSTAMIPNQSGSNPIRGSSSVGSTDGQSRSSEPSEPPPTQTPGSPVTNTPTVSAVPPLLVPATTGQGSIVGQVSSSEEMIDASYLIEVQEGQQLQVQLESGAAFFDICPRIEERGVSCLAIRRTAEEPLDRSVPRTGIYRINVVSDRPTNYTLRVYLNGVPYVLPN
ncbi:caspase family protein [Oscillatoria sp. FACHB-1407]|uniref:caspase family protein n=1 Tax=Oscillatoria sp. FACHB-1407 TaxID=2692847 RepID=UPI001681EF89|nr:caspase family protein [Oscillatoria sp. FACHB-1407]MBD2460344.1 caspase family protein [Oscillatoria sp. FACHB-1407]